VGRPADGLLGHSCPIRLLCLCGAATGTGLRHLVCLTADHHNPCGSDFGRNRAHQAVGRSHRRSDRGADRHATGSGQSLAHLAALLAAVCGAAISVISRKIGQDERAVVLLLFPMVGNFLAMALALPFVYKPMPVEHLGLLAVIAGLGMAGAYLIILAYRKGEAVIVAPMQYSQILWATAYGYLLFSETPDAPTVLGAAVIILSGIYIVFREGRSGASLTRPVLETGGRAETATTPRSSALQRFFPSVSRPPR
jgi:uncharacterized membrane protein